MMPDVEIGISIFDKWLPINGSFDITLFISETRIEVSTILWTGVGVGKISGGRVWDRNISDVGV